MQLPINYIFSAIIVLISLSAHELAHGYTAYKLGDPTAKHMGRLTLNPIKHIDPLGLVSMIFFRIGWAKPVPINPRYFKKAKRDTAICALAGPSTNLVIAFISTFIYMLMIKAFTGVSFNDEFLFNLVDNTCLFVYLFAIVGKELYKAVHVPRSAVAVAKDVYHMVDVLSLCAKLRKILRHSY